MLFVCGLFVVAFSGFCSFCSRQDEEQNKSFEEKHGITFRLNESFYSLKDYAEWVFFQRTMIQTRQEIEVQQAILNEELDNAKDTFLVNN